MSSKKGKNRKKGSMLQLPPLASTALPYLTALDRGSMRSQLRPSIVMQPSLKVMWADQASPRDMLSYAFCFEGLIAELFGGILEYKAMTDLCIENMLAEYARRIFWRNVVAQCDGCAVDAPGRHPVPHCPINRDLHDNQSTPFVDPGEINSAIQRVSGCLYHLWQPPQGQDLKGQQEYFADVKRQIILPPLHKVWQKVAKLNGHSTPSENADDYFVKRDAAIIQSFLDRAEPHEVFKYIQARWWKMTGQDDLTHDGAGWNDGDGSVRRRLFDTMTNTVPPKDNHFMSGELLYPSKNRGFHAEERLHPHVKMGMGLMNAIKDNSSINAV